MRVISVCCPHCGVAFDAAFDATVAEADLPPLHPLHSVDVEEQTAPRRPSTLRSLQATNVPIRGDRAPVCRRCGLVSMFHDGVNNLAMIRYDCHGFESKDAEDVES